MKTTKSLLYGLILVTGLAACSKDYNSSPATNGNAFGGTNPVAPITGAGTDEMVFKEDGATVRISKVFWTGTGNLRSVTGAVATADGKVTAYTIAFRPYFSDVSLYTGSGSAFDTLIIQKAIVNPGSTNPADAINYTSGGFLTTKAGYSYSKVTDTAKTKFKGEFSGRLIRIDPTDLNKEFSEYIDITSGFFNASEYMMP